MSRAARDPIAQERARALAARKVLPWIAASALGAAALVKVAGATLAGAAVVVALGLVLAIFVWTLSIARCPSCGKRLPRATAEPAATGGGAKRCAVCGSA